MTPGDLFDYLSVVQKAASTIEFVAQNDDDDEMQKKQNTFIPTAAPHLIHPNIEQKDRFSQPPIALEIVWIASVWQRVIYFCFQFGFFLVTK